MILTSNSIPIKSDGLLDLEKQPNANYTGTELWNAPEVFEEDPELVSTKSEIFSFGLVLYECIALCPPHTLQSMADPKKALDFDNCESDEEDEDEELDYMVGTRPNFPEGMNLSSAYDDILQVFYVCTDENPESRPDAQNLETIFKELKEK